MSKEGSKQTQVGGLYQQLIAKLDEMQINQEKALREISEELQDIQQTRITLVNKLDNLSIRGSTNVNNQTLLDPNPETNLTAIAYSPEDPGYKVMSQVHGQIQPQQHQHQIQQPPPVESFPEKSQGVHKFTPILPPINHMPIEKNTPQAITLQQTVTLQLATDQFQPEYQLQHKKTKQIQSNQKSNTSSKSTQPKFTNRQRKSFQKGIQIQKAGQTKWNTHMQLGFFARIHSEGHKRWLASSKLALAIAVTCQTKYQQWGMTWPSRNGRELA